MAGLLQLAGMMKDRALEKGIIIKGRTVYDYLISNSTPEKAVLYLHSLVVGLKPEICLEIGTCLGFSTLFIADALNKNGKGSLITIEKDETSSNLARELIGVTDSSRVIFKIGRTQNILPSIIENLEKIDFCYIDGEHRKEAVLFEFDLVFSKLSKGGIIVMDDVIANNDEMRETWAIIKSKDGLEWSEHEMKFGIIKKTGQ